jgi:probable blue pigment (indigoidine) exporter
MAAVIMAAVPLFTLLLAAVHHQEHLTLRGIIGGLLAIAGIGVLSLRSLSGDVPFLYVTAAVGAALATAEAAVLVKAFLRTHPVTTNAIGMVAGSALLWVASALVGESWTVPQQARTGIVVAWLVIVGSVGLFYLVLFVIQRWTASATAYSLTLMPVVAVAVGAVLAHEAISVEVAIGAVLVLLAVYVGALRQPSRSRGPRTGASVRSAR